MKQKNEFNLANNKVAFNQRTREKRSNIGIQPLNAWLVEQQCGLICTTKTMSRWDLNCRCMRWGLVDISHQRWSRKRNQTWLSTLSSWELISTYLVEPTIGTKEPTLGSWPTWNRNTDEDFVVLCAEVRSPVYCPPGAPGTVPWSSRPGMDLVFLCFPMFSLYSMNIDPFWIANFLAKAT